MFAKQNKANRLQVQLPAAHTNKASLHSTVDGTVSTGTLPHSSKGAAEVLPTIDESRSSDVVSTQSITARSSSGRQFAATLPNTMHTSQVLPLSKFSGNNDNEMFREWHEQFELVATVCGWNSQSKLANLATRLQGQDYALYCTCTVQQRSSYESLVMAVTEVHSSKDTVSKEWVTPQPQTEG